MKIHIQLSESLSRPEPENWPAAEGNCVVVRQGGKQLEAESQSRTEVNSIRLKQMASLLPSGEACSEENDRYRWHGLVNIEYGVCFGGWSENAMKDMYLSGEICAEQTQPEKVVRTEVRAVV